MTRKFAYIRMYDNNKPRLSLWRIGAFGAFLLPFSLA